MHVKTPVTCARVFTAHVPSRPPGVSHFHALPPSSAVALHFSPCSSLFAGPFALHFALLCAVVLGRAIGDCWRQRVVPWPLVLAWRVWLWPGGIDDYTYIYREVGI